MQVAIASPLPVAPVAPMPPSTPVASPASEAEGGSPFAKLLNQHQNPTRTEEASAEAPAPEQATDSGAVLQPTGTAVQHPAARSAQRPNPERPRAVRAEAPLLSCAADAVVTLDIATDASVVTDAKESADTVDDKPPTLDPALSDWLATLHRPIEVPPAVAGVAAVATSTPTPSAPAAADTGSEPAAALSAPGPVSGGAHKPDPAKDKAGPEAKLPVADLVAAPAPGTPAEAMVATLARETQAPSRPLEAVKHTELLSLPAVAAPAAQVHGEALPGAVSASVAAPLTSPEFREALGVQVSVLARAGVQHAELHLNPADMGPVSVQITMNGSDARVDFGADSANTRQVIESSLPELAAALRDAGLTLSGGGVSQHARHRAQADEFAGAAAASSRGRGAVADDDAPVARTLNLRVPLGKVDVYA